MNSQLDCSKANYMNKRVNAIMLTSLGSGYEVRHFWDMCSRLLFLSFSLVLIAWTINRFKSSPLDVVPTLNYGTAAAATCGACLTVILSSQMD